MADSKHVHRDDPGPNLPAPAGPPDPVRRVLGCNPVASPAWRWRRAMLVAEGVNVPPDWSADPVIRAAMEFLRARASGTPVSGGPLAHAVKIYEGDGQVRWYLESLVLTRMKPKSIGRRVGVDPDVVEAYEELFFDARPRIRAAAWIQAFAIGVVPSLGIDPADVGGLWRVVAYHRGLRALELVMAVTTGNGRDRFPVEELEAAELMIALLRIRVDRDPARVLQLHLRLQAEANGLPPSCYHFPRRRRQPAGAAIPTEIPLTQVPHIEHLVGELGATSHNAGVGE